MRIGKIGAALLLSAPFGWIHAFNEGGTWAGALSTGSAGLLLSLAYFRTRSLWLPVGMHISWNFSIAWIFSLPVSGEKIPTTWFDATVSGPAWLSGGTFGPEGSVLAFLAMGVLASFFVRSRRIDPSPQSVAWVPPPEERKPERAEEETQDESGA
jgi:membrane protease YdiL (CAAX protease family)